MMSSRTSTSLFRRQLQRRQQQGYAHQIRITGPINHLHRLKTRPLQRRRQGQNGRRGLGSYHSRPFQEVSRPPQTLHHLSIWRRRFGSFKSSNTICLTERRSVLLIHQPVRIGVFDIAIRTLPAANIRCNHANRSAAKGRGGIATLLFFKPAAEHIIVGHRWYHCQQQHSPSALCDAPARRLSALLLRCRAA